MARQRFKHLAPTGTTGDQNRRRLAIAGYLARGEARVVDLTRELRLPQSTVSSHQVFYALAALELLDLFAAAETLLAAPATGRVVPELRR